MGRARLRRLSGRSGMMTSAQPVAKARMSASDSITRVPRESTPRYGGVGGSVTGGVSQEHDIIGHGWVEIDNNAITVAVHPRVFAAPLNPAAGTRPSAPASAAPVSAHHPPASALLHGGSEGPICCRILHLIITYRCPSFRTRLCRCTS